jgi:tetraacyldisaccharide 4'-kinase
MVDYDYDNDNGNDDRAGIGTSTRDTLVLSPNDIWYGRSAIGRVLAGALAPLGWLYCGVAAARALGYRRGWFASFDVGVPVIVVGNLSVGGTGKTPLVRWLAAYLHHQGLRPGIAARGHGAAAAADPARVQRVPVDADPALYGDEPALLARDGGAPVVVGRDRVAAARALVRQTNCDVVITDDGLQHYRLRRTLEILVVDGQRLHGNRRCLPAGPLREPVGRARRADLCVTTGGGLIGSYGVSLEPGAAVNLVDPGLKRPLSRFAGRAVTAVAGIGNPERFFGMLRSSSIEIVPRPYPDHHAFSAEDIRGWGSGPVLMTEKDAVKCRRLLPGAEHWFVPVSARPEPGFAAALDALLRARQITSASIHRN